MFFRSLHRNLRPPFEYIMSSITSAVTVSRRSARLSTLIAQKEDKPHEALEEQHTPHKKRKDGKLVEIELKNNEDHEAPSPSKKRKLKVATPIIYIIPEVEKKETTFKGELRMHQFEIR
jgi:hypothetical protein